MVTKDATPLSAFKGGLGGVTHVYHSNDMEATWQEIPWPEPVTRWMTEVGDVLDVTPDFDNGGYYLTARTPDGEQQTFHTARGLVAIVRGDNSSL